tara:strand:+ start:79 stop:813 length:735 start_codon:yes stop_codon:yes gene_type:complete
MEKMYRTTSWGIFFLSCYSFLSEDILEKLHGNLISIKIREKFKKGLIDSGVIKLSKGVWIPSSKNRIENECKRRGIHPGRLCLKSKFGRPLRSRIFISLMRKRNYFINGVKIKPSRKEYKGDNEIQKIVRESGLIRSEWDEPLLLKDIINDMSSHGKKNIYTAYKLKQIVCLPLEEWIQMNHSMEDIKKIIIDHCLNKWNGIVDFSTKDFDQMFTRYLMDLEDTKPEPCITFYDKKFEIKRFIL